MQPKPTFIFQASEVFGLAGRGLVFRGHAVQGHIRVGQMVEFKGKHHTHSACVAAIELDRKLIEQSVHGPELGLLLNAFDSAAINETLESARSPEAAAALPTPQNLLAIELPLDIHENAAQQA